MAFNRNRSVRPNRTVSDGLDMLDTKRNVLNSKNQLGKVENRIRRLLYEEERAHKLTDVAN